MTSSLDWTEGEVKEAVEAYFLMLLAELEGRSFVKTEVNKALRNQLNGRTKGSVEFKFQNISAVLLDLGVAYVEGYKPARNVQGLLRREVTRAVESNHALAATMKRLVHEGPPLGHLGLELELVPEPVRDEAKVSNGRIQDRMAAHPLLPNWLEIEASNAKRGRFGEELVVRYEHERLWTAGRKDLAERVEHVAATQGDGLGYDVHSFDATGRDRLIEVKTTRFGAFTPFFASRNEVAVSANFADSWHLYRLFSVERAPKCYTKPGSLIEHFDLEPTTFEARLR